MYAFAILVRRREVSQRRPYAWHASKGLMYPRVLWTQAMRKARTNDVLTTIEEKCHCHNGMGEERKEEEDGVGEEGFL